MIVFYWWLFEEQSRCQALMGHIVRPITAEFVLAYVWLFACVTHRVIHSVWNGGSQRVGAEWGKIKGMLK